DRNVTGVQTCALPIFILIIMGFLGTLFSIAFTILSEDFWSLYDRNRADRALFSDFILKLLLAYSSTSSITLFNVNAISPGKSLSRSKCEPRLPIKRFRSN